MKLIILTLKLKFTTFIFSGAKAGLEKVKQKSSLSDKVFKRCFKS